MTERTFWEKVEATGTDLLDKLQELVKAGNIRRIRVKQKGATVAEFPLTVGVVGAVFAPVLAAVGALVALAADCSIEIERVVPAEEPPPV